MIEPVKFRPEGMPKDYNELFSGAWMKHITQQVRRRNKIVRDFEDALASITEKLFAAQVLDKFVLKAATRQPDVFTAEQVCAYLGISWGSWFAIMNAYHCRNQSEAIQAHADKLRQDNEAFLALDPEYVAAKNAEIAEFNANRAKGAAKLKPLRLRKNWQRRVPVWMPTPVVKGREEGTWEQKATRWHAKDALYLFVEVQDLDALIDQDDSNVFPSRKGEDRPHNLPITSKGFKEYLNQAIARHFFNLCRTKRRRFNREHVFDGTAILKVDSSGNFHQSGAFEDATSWEDNIAGGGLGSEDLYDCITFKRRAEALCNEAGIDLSRINEYIAGQSTDDGVGPTPEALQALKVLDAYTQTGDLMAAIRKSQVKTRVRARLG